MATVVLILSRVKVPRSPVTPTAGVKCGEFIVLHDIAAYLVEVVGLIVVNLETR